MGKIDIEFIPDSRQGSVGCIKQGVCGEIIHSLSHFPPPREYAKESEQY